MEKVMDERAFLNRFLLMKPTLIMGVGLLVIIIIGILGEVFSWIKIGFTPYSHFIGGAVAVFGFVMHQYCHRIHKQAHEKSQRIEGIVATGFFGKIRHPMYLSLIIMFLGLAIGWGILWMFAPAVFFSAVTVLIAIKEEEFLLKKFGNQYEEYLHRVRWRMIPRVF
jgi:protein-S-isoprenylcysteine O-methyltransferase Ste14